MNCCLCFCTESKPENMLSSINTIFCKEEGIRGKQRQSVFSKLEAVPASNFTMTHRKKF